MRRINFAVIRVESNTDRLRDQNFVRCTRIFTIIVFFFFFYHLDVDVYSVKIMWLQFIQRLLHTQNGNNCDSFL